MGCKYFLVCLYIKSKLNVQNMKLNYDFLKKKLKKSGLAFECYCILKQTTKEQNTTWVFRISGTTLTQSITQNITAVISFCRKAVTTSRALQHQTVPLGGTEHISHMGPRYPDWYLKCSLTSAKTSIQFIRGCFLNPDHPYLLNYTEEFERIPKNWPIFIFAYLQTLNSYRGVGSEHL